MKNKLNSAIPHALEKVWAENPKIFSTNVASKKTPSVETLFGDFFTVGEYYFYILDVPTGALSHQNITLLDHHTFETPPAHVNEILTLIHPEDLPFVLKAEKACYAKISEIGIQHLSELKTSYNFRMKTCSGDYNLYHHQAVHILMTDEGRVQQAVNIHTNIQHITSKNRYTALVSGIGSRRDYHQIQVLELDEPLIETCLTRREVEIVTLIAKGLSTQEISSKLCISMYTVATHRKNILAKAKCKNSSELIKKALEQGVI